VADETTLERDLSEISTRLKDRRRHKLKRRDARTGSASKTTYSFRKCSHCMLSVLSTL